VFNQKNAQLFSGPLFNLQTNATKAACLKIVHDIQSRAGSGRNALFTRFENDRPAARCQRPPSFLRISLECLLTAQLPAKVFQCLRLPLLILTLLLLLPVTTRGAVVTNLTETALREALAQTGTNPVTFGSNGTTLQLTRPISICRDTIIEGPSSRRISLQGSNDTQIFVVLPDIKLTLRNLTLANGRSQSGGAILNQGTISISNCTFSANSAIGGNGTAGNPGSRDYMDGKDGSAGTNGLGGAIYNFKNASLFITSSIFSNNTAVGGNGGAGGNGTNSFPIGGLGGNGGDGGDGAEAYGGAIFNEGILEIAGSTLRGNLVTAGNGGSNGLATSSFLGADGGGGVGGDAWGAAIFDLGTTRISASAFFDNKVTGGNTGRGPSREDGKPGGDASGGSIASRGNVVLINSTFSNNQALGGSGGAGGNGMFGGNGGRGGDALGGSLFSAGSAQVSHCTFSGNGAFPGAGGSAGSGNFPGDFGGTGELGGAHLHQAEGTFTLVNSILNNSLSGPNSSGSINDLGHNISSDGSSNLNGPGTLKFVNPLLEAPADNGGLTYTMALRAGSPANNGADKRYLPSPPLDQRGFIRNTNGVADVGAYERGDFFLKGRVTQNGVPVAGEKMQARGPSPANNLNTAFTGTNGYYTFQDLVAGTYTIEAASSPSLFTPAKIVSTISTSNIPNLNFIKSFISGRVTSQSSGVSNVTVTADGFSTLTDQNGFYAIPISRAGVYAVTPTLAGLIFTPPSASNTTSNFVATNVNFTVVAGSIPSPTRVSSTNAPGTSAINIIFPGVPGQVYGVQTSTNLITWSLMTNQFNPTASGQISFRTNVSNLPSLFFRSSQNQVPPTP